jgi:hypothetical protein
MDLLSAKAANKKQPKIGLMAPMIPEKRVGPNNFLTVARTKKRELSSIKLSPLCKNLHIIFYIQIIRYFHEFEKSFLEDNPLVVHFYTMFADIYAIIIEIRKLFET